MRLKRAIGRGLLVAAAVYVAWLGVQIAAYRVWRAADPAEGTGIPDIAGGQPLYEVEGVYHVHSKNSDGFGTVDHIARAASRAGLDFCILTDHGRPNRASLAAQGWRDGVLVLAGSELSVNRGHLVGMGFRLLPDGRAGASQPDFSHRAEDAVQEIRARGGLAVIAHPYSKVRWTWGEASDYAGLEIINADTMVKDNLRRLIPYLPALLIRPGLPLLKALDPPDAETRKWDERGAGARVFGYFSADAHLFYRPLFGFLHLHVLLDAPLPRPGEDFDAAFDRIFAALREGRFYNAVEAAAEADGFRFEVRTAEGARFRMGAEAEIDRAFFAGPDGVAPFRAPVLAVDAPFPFRHAIRLLRDGAVVDEAGAGRTLVYRVPEPGTYRVEVYLKARSPLGHDVPWIVSNPITLRAKG